MAVHIGGGVQRLFPVWIVVCALAVRASAQTLPLPPRPPNAPTGSQFITLTTPMSLAQRESWIYYQVLTGNVPEFLRVLVPIQTAAVINGVSHTATYYVIPDYLAIGTDADYLLQPMTPLLAQRLADALGASLPTRKMVDQIWAAASVQLNPQPIPPSAEMITVPVFSQHNNMVRTQRNSFTNASPLGALVSGDKKDVILSTKIYTNFANAGITKPVVIYGWHYTNGSAIQPLYNGHEETYADYSHGARLVQNAMILDGAPANLSNVLANPAVAGLISDEGAAEGTTNGVIAKPRYTISAMAAALLIPPRSQTVLPGTLVRFHAVATGQAPLSYRWSFNGAALSSETNSSLILSNAQPFQAGLYSMVVTNNAGSSSFRPAVLQVLQPTHPVLFSETFETNVSGDWNLYWGASNAIADYTVHWSFDHQFTPATFNGFTTPIAPAPHSANNASHALRLTANGNDTIGSIAAVNVYPRELNLHGDFALKFDLWLNYPGDAGGINATGSTQHAIFGIDHLGVQANWAAPSASSSDGLWFAVDGEGGTTRDYRGYVGNLAGTQIELIGQAASGLFATDNSAATYQTLFPPSRFETAGAPGKNWVEVELRQTNNLILWLLDGTVIAQRTNDSVFNTGTIMLGLMDLFSSIANPPQDAFVLFDNIRIEDLTDRIRFLNLQRATTGEVRLKLSAVPGRSYVVDWSTDLLVWHPLPAVRADNGPVEIMDQAAGIDERRFYRAREQPGP